MKTGRKVVTAEGVLVVKGENLVPNVTDTVTMSSPGSSNRGFDKYRQPAKHIGYFAHRGCLLFLERRSN